MAIPYSTSDSAFYFNLFSKVPIYPCNASRTAQFPDFPHLYETQFCFFHQYAHSNIPKDFRLMVPAFLYIDTRSGQYPLEAD